MKKIIVLLPLLLFINAKGFGREIIRFIPIDLERTYLVSKCECGNPVAIDYLLYSPKTQYYYYPSGEICPLESIKCNSCEEKQEEGKNKKAVGLLIIASAVVILILVGALLG